MGGALRSFLLSQPTPPVPPFRRRIGLKLHRLAGDGMRKPKPVRVQGRVGKRLE
jgi:hypothetical protein